MRRRSAMRGWTAIGLAVLFAMVGVEAAAAAPESAGPKAPETRLVGVVNVNTATSDELQLLPGIGPVRAVAIVDHRRDHGAFKSADGLVAVSGIGERALARIRAHIAVAGKTTAKLQ